MTSSFQATDTLHVDDQSYRIYPFSKVQQHYPVDKLPFSLKILLENLLRHANSNFVTDDDIKALANWSDINFCAGVRKTFPTLRWYRRAQVSCTR